MKESSLTRITWGFIWRLVLWTICLMIVLGFITNVLLGAVAYKNAGSIFNVESTISFYRFSFIITIIVDLIICFVSCRFATTDIIKKFDTNANKNGVIRNVTIVVIIVALSIILWQIANVKDTINELEKLKQTYEKVTTHFADENDVSDAVKVTSFIDYCKGIVIVSILSHAAIYIALIGFERMWLEEARE